MISPCFSASLRCLGVARSVKPSKPASATASIFFSSGQGFFAVGVSRSDQRFAMWRMHGLPVLGWAIGWWREFKQQRLVDVKESSVEVRIRALDEPE